jgi:hypothetical protein
MDLCMMLKDTTTKKEPVVRMLREMLPTIISTEKNSQTYDQLIIFDKYLKTFPASYY